MELLEVDTGGGNFNKKLGRAENVEVIVGGRESLQ